LSKPIELKVSKIENGTVIDHIEPGYALHVLKVLGITGKEGHVVAVVMNVRSSKMGRKDIVKVEGLELSKEQVDLIALISPRVTINIIRDYRVAKKFKVKPPERIDNLLKCVNPNCITNQPNEPIQSSFKMVSIKPLIYVCEYCGAKLTLADILTQIR